LFQKLNNEEKAMKRLLLFSICTLILLIFNLPSVYACSGGSNVYPTVDTMLGGDVLVRGIIIENSGGNSIIEVERYLRGNGSRYLLVYRQSPANYVIKAVRGYADNPCDYPMPAIGEVGTRAYFSLNRSGNGSYTTSYYEYENIFEISDDADGQFVHYWEDMEGSEERIVSQGEFETMIAERTGNRGIVPDEYSPMPRFRVLTITTESGQIYQLPVDSDEIYPVETNYACTENCPIISPDGSHYAVPNPNEADSYWAWFRPNPNGDDWSQGIGESEYALYPPEFHAQSILFSPDSDYLLAWYEGSISLYAFNAWEAWGFYGHLPTLEQVWSAELALSETMTADSFRGLGAWSGNSNAFAYWDADGLKWLDISVMRVPRLVLQHESQSVQGFVQGVSGEIVPPLLELSSTGRYIRYGQVDEWRLLDILTGVEYDDALVNPDETRFVALSPEEAFVDTAREETGNCIMFDLQGNCHIPNERSVEYCILPMATCSAYVNNSAYQPREVHWRNNSSLVYMACENNESNRCFVLQRDFEQDYYSDETPRIYQSNAFAYDEHYGYVAWATADNYLRLTANSYEDWLDLSTVLDSPIVSLEWGAPLWYLGEE
jgi:hypothetical protein